MIWRIASRYIWPYLSLWRHHKGQVAVSALAFWYLNAVVLRVQSHLGHFAHFICPQWRGLAFSYVVVFVMITVFSFAQMQNSRLQRCSRNFNKSRYIANQDLSIVAFFILKFGGSDVACWMWSMVVQLHRPWNSRIGSVKSLILQNSVTCFRVRKMGKLPTFISLNLSMWSNFPTSLISFAKKILWSFARVVRRDHVNRARNPDHVTRTCERFDSHKNKIAWIPNMADTLRIREVRKGVWAFVSWLCFSDADWLGRQTHYRLIKHLFLAVS